MRKLLFILFVFIILGCNQNLKKKGLLLGTWDVVSETDIETGKVRFPESDDLWFVEFKSDSIYVSSNPNEGAAWRIEGDSIFIDDDKVPFYIKELSQNTLIAEYGFLSKRKFLITLNKRK